MTVRRAALFGLLLALDATASLHAQDPDPRTWRLTVEADRSALAYGTANAEDTPVTFSCENGRGTVEIFINETGKGVGPGRAIASLGAGPTTTKVWGEALPNEDVGVPSFTGTFAAAEPLFAALSKAPLLVIEVGPSRQELPLREIGDKGDRFQGTCRKR